MVNKFLLARNKFMSEMHLMQPGFTIVSVGPLLKTKNGYKNLNKQKIQDVFIKTSYIKLVFNMIWLMEILRTYLEE